jgi:hypothetical protein
MNIDDMNQSIVYDYLGPASRLWHLEDSYHLHITSI